MQDDFHFKKFSICQRKSAMKVGTDGVLLGAWFNGADKILDIGAGTGIISMMAAQRYPESLVTGIEIDHDAATEAEENVEASPYSDRINIIETALQGYTPKEKFGAIVTNPPFFAHGFNVADEARRKARQTDTLSFKDILDFSKEWLEPSGEISVVLPTDVMEEFSSRAFMLGFFQTRKYTIKTVPRKTAKRCLLAFSLSRPNTFDAAEVSLNDGIGGKSEWYQKLTQDFYL